MRLEQLLEASARRSPENPAVVEPGNCAVSYRELDAVAGEIREALARAGVSAGDRVGICAPKSIATVASIFGILKAGAAYVPVDPSAPPSRSAYIFDDCTTKAIIADRRLAPGLLAQFGAHGHEPLLELAVTKPLGVALTVLVLRKRDPTAAATSEENIAYILYTSGSTGKPKGVIHTHASALSFIDWCSKELEPRDTDRFSSHAPFHFDLSILDIYVPLKHGAAVVLLGEELGKQPLGVVDAHCPATDFDLVLDAFDRCAYCWSSADCSAINTAQLRTVIFAGEVFPTKHLRALKAAWPLAVWYNLYGPTETNVCTYYRLPDQLPADRTEPCPDRPTLLR